MPSLFGEPLAEASVIAELESRAANPPDRMTHRT
jgi:hypothetical protein